MRRALSRRRRSDYVAKRRAMKFTTIVEDVSRDEIIARDGQDCYLCGEWVSIREMTFDHVVPLSKGGTHTPENVKLAHRGCNSRKGAKLL